MLTWRAAKGSLPHRWVRARFLRRSLTGLYHRSRCCCLRDSNPLIVVGVPEHRRRPCRGRDRLRGRRRRGDAGRQARGPASCRRERLLPEPPNRISFHDCPVDHSMARRHSPLASGCPFLRSSSYRPGGQTTFNAGLASHSYHRHVRLVHRVANRVLCRQRTTFTGLARAPALRVLDNPERRGRSHPHTGSKTSSAYREFWYRRRLDRSVPFVKTLSRLLSTAAICLLPTALHRWTHHGAVGAKDTAV